MFTTMECTSRKFATPTSIRLRDIFDQPGAAKVRALDNNKSKYDKK